MLAVVIGHGELEAGPRLRALAQQAVLIVCADGGAAHAITLGIQPHIIIGDLDSVAPDALAHWRERDVVVEQHPVAKDKTDLELALEWALAHGATDLRLFGTLGGRLDHALANILLLSAPLLQSAAVCLEDERTTVTLLTDGGTISLEGRIGDTVSLLPLSAHVTSITTTGLVYPLVADTLVRGSTRGVSNELNAAHASVRIGQGQLYVVHVRSLAAS